MPDETADAAVAIEASFAELADLLESAWGLIAGAGWGGLAKTEGWQAAAVVWRDRYHLMLGGTPPPAAEGATPEPAGRLARIEVKGFRDLGVVRVTETTFAGEPMVHAERTPWSSEAFEGDAADFPASSLHFVTWLPERLIAEGTHRAISGRDYIGPPDIDDRDDYPDRSY